MTTTTNPGEVFAALRRDGWRIERTGKGHTKVTAPDGRVLVTSLSAVRRRKNEGYDKVRWFLRDLRRMGWTP